MYFISRSLLLKALGWSLINSLWQMALLWLVYIAITGTTKRFSAKVRHNLALICYAAASGWFVLTFLESFGNEEVFRQGFTSIILMTGTKFANTFLTVKKYIDLSLPYLSFIYLGTILILSLRYVRYYLHLRLTKISGLQKIKPGLRMFTSSIATQIGIRRKVAVWLSSLVDSPMTVGFLKPMILIPIATINHLTTEQVESILLHELTHIKRNDYLVNLFVTVNSIIFFFNPFSKLFVLTIKKEREHSCDDMVLQFQYKPHTYASALLSLEKTRHHHQLAMTAVGRNNKLLLERVKRVTGHTHKAHRNSPGLICFFFVSMIIGLALFIKPIEHPIEIGKRVLGSTEVKYAKYIEPVTSHAGFAVVQEPKGKAKKPAQVKNKQNAAVEENLEIPMDNDGIRYVNEMQPEVQDDENTDDAVVNTADQKEAAEFSIGSQVSPRLPAVGSANDYPYVPNSSFSFQLINDSASDNAFNWRYVGVVTDKDMQKALIVLKAINWEKIEKELSCKGKSIDAAKIEEEIRKCIERSEIKINEDVAIVINRNDERKVRENLRDQLMTLRNLKIAADPKARPAQCPHARRQEAMQQEELKKQVENMRKAQEVLKKKVRRVIYI